MMTILSGIPYLMIGFIFGILFSLLFINSTLPSIPNKKKTERDYEQVGHFNRIYTVSVSGEQPINHDELIDDAVRLIAWQTYDDSHII